MAKHRCEAQVRYPGRRPHYHQCERNGKHDRYGKWYCGTHDPVRVEERLAKRLAGYHEKWGRSERAGKRRTLEHEFCKDMADAELRAGIAKKKVGE